MNYGLQIELLTADRDKFKQQRDALEIIAVCVAGALEKAGFEEVDNPADAIEILAQQRDELLAALKEISGLSNVTATDKRFIYVLQNLASEAIAKCEA